MKQFLLSIFLLVSYNQSVFGQINFSGCTAAVAGAYPYTLNLSGTVGARNTYTSSPAACALSAACVYRIIYTGTQWEVRLSSDAGATFPFLLYSNAAASTPNPPDLSLGTWADGGSCGGENISVLNGDVQSTLVVLPIELMGFSVEKEKNKSKLS